MACFVFTAGDLRGSFFTAVVRYGKVKLCIKQKLTEYYHLGLFKVMFNLPTTTNHHFGLMFFFPGVLSKSKTIISYDLSHIPIDQTN